MSNVTEKTLWKNFSKYIRLRDTFDGIHVKCISCGRIHHWKEMQCGHYKSRRYPNTKYDEKNNNAQCVYCNRYLKGNESSYGLALDRKYGEGTAEWLDIKAKSPGKKLNQMQINVLNDVYKKKLIELKKAKGL